MENYLRFAQSFPDIGGSVLHGYQQGEKSYLAEQQRQNQMAIGQSIGQGGYLSGANKAFESGDLQTGVDLSNLSQKQQENLNSWAERFAEAAGDDEQLWNRGVEHMQRMGLPVDDESFRFENRGMWRKQAEQDLSLTGIYDEKTGQEQKVIFDKKTGKYVPVGGTKAQSGGISFTTPDGSTIEIGGSGGSAVLGTTARGQVQQKAVNTAEMGARISSIAADFKPEYLTLGTRFANVWRSGKARIDPGSLGAGERKSLADYAAFRSKSIGNVNRLLNELSGAAVSPQEAERLKAEVPNPGTGWFDGDDPVTFQAKMERIMSDSNAALARYRYYQSVGIPNNIEQVPLANVKNIDGVWHVMDGGKVYRIGEIREVQE